MARTSFATAEPSRSLRSGPAAPRFWRSARTARRASAPVRRAPRDDPCPAGDAARPRRRRGGAFRQLRGLARDAHPPSGEHRLSVRHLARRGPAALDARELGCRHERRSRQAPQRRGGRRARGPVGRGGGLNKPSRRAPARAPAHPRRGESDHRLRLAGADPARRPALGATAPRAVHGPSRLPAPDRGRCELAARDQHGAWRARLRDDGAAGGRRRLSRGPGAR